MMSDFWAANQTRMPIIYALYESRPLLYSLRFLIIIDFGHSEKLTFHSGLFDTAYCVFFRKIFNTMMLLGTVPMERHPSNIMVRQK